MSFFKTGIFQQQKSFTPKNLIYSKEKKHYLNENDNSTDSTEQQYESKALLKTDKIIGNYTLTKQIDKSSYTKIFLAKHILTGEDVKIRIINKQLFKNDLLSMTRFNKELQIIKIVKHQNIIKLLEIIETNTKIYLITEYFPNNLLSYIQLEKKLSENKARFLFQQIISALNYLHEMGISHRNIKPENILLDEKYLIVKITGFGVSTFDSKDEFLRSPVGNLIYAPPEMILSQKYKGELNDIWDVGIVLYAMVCGNLPFSEDNQDININHIVEGFYDIPKDISTECVEVINACLECNPDKRITFNKLKDLEWIKYKNFKYIKGININKENIVIEEAILQECKKYISANNQDLLNKIRKSVIENKFDEFSSLYYLVFQKQMKKGYKFITSMEHNNNNLHNIIFNYINLTNNNNKREKEERKKYSSFTNINLYSSFLLKKSKKIDIFDNSIGRKSDLVCRNLFSQTIRKSKDRKNNIINISSPNIREKKSLCSPKNYNSFHSSQFYYKKIFNGLNPSNVRVNKVSESPKIYKKKANLVVNKYKSSFEIKNSTISSESKKYRKIENNNKKNINTSKKKTIKFKEENNENNNSNIDEIKPLNTLFVNRVKSINNNFYSIHKKNNKSIEGICKSTKLKNINRTNKNNLISINKKNLFINVNNNKIINENFDNIDILMDDQPVANFSINFNKTLLNNNKNLSNLLNQDELSMNNYFNTNETFCFNKKSLIQKQKTNAKSYKSLDYFFQTPIKRFGNNIYYNKLNKNYHFKLRTYKNEDNHISNSFYKLMPQKKLFNQTELRNTAKEKMYNNTIYNEEKTLNKIKSFGGIRMARKKTDNTLPKKLSQNTFTLNSNHKINKFYGTIEKKKNSYKDCSKLKKKLSMNKFKKSLEIINNDMYVLDLSCLKFSIYEDLIDKICNTLKKNKIKYNIINSNKIHCSGRNGLFFNIEIYNINSKKINKTNNNNININNNKTPNEYYSAEKIEYTSLGFKKKTINNIENNQNQKKELYYINFCNKKTDFNIFNKNKRKLIIDMLY